MGARDLLGQPVEPFVSEDPPATIPLKVPLFAQVLPVLRDLSAHTFQMLRLWKGIQGEAEAEAPSTKSPYEMAVPLVRACLVEELSEDDVFELLGRLGVRLELDLNHPLLERCLTLAGQPPRDEDDGDPTERDEKILELLGGKAPSVVDPISG